MQAYLTTKQAAAILGMGPHAVRQPRVAKPQSQTTHESNGD